MPKNSGIPKKAKLVFSGEIFKVYQWPQKMFDGSYETFEKLTRPDNVTIFATVGKKILLLKEKQPDSPDYFLTLPTGRVDKRGEKPLTAAKRELLEETGYQSNDWKLYKAFPTKYKVLFTQHVFVARNCKLVSEPKLDKGEKIKVGYMSFTDLFCCLDKEKVEMGQMLLIDLMKVERDKKKKKIFKKLLFK